MHRNGLNATRGAIRMGLLLGVAIAALLAVIVGVLGYTTNQEVTEIFDRSARDSREIAEENISRFTELLASNTAVTVRPSVLDHNYSYIRGVLADMTAKDSNLLYIGVLDVDGEVVEESGNRTAGGAIMKATSPITSQQREVGTVELLYSTATVDARIRDAQEQNQQRRSDSIRTLIIGGVVVLGICVFLAAALGVWLSRPVTKMAQAAGKLGLGDFDVRVDVSGPAELRQLATTFNSMAGELEASVNASIEQAALEREVATARRLQSNMMPPDERIVAGDLEIASWYAPAGKMGGDWWTVTEPEQGKPVTVLIGDVIGHGIPAALFTAAAKSAHRTARILGADGGPHEILATIDEALRGFSETPTMSCCAAHFDVAARELSYSIGAHPAPLRFRLDGGSPVMDILDGEGPLLGDPIPGPAFRCVKQDLRPGDVLALFTDGIIEATDDRERMFGLRRLAAAIKENLGEDLDQILASLKQTFHSYVKDTEVDDDVTVVLIRYAPSEDRA